MAMNKRERAALEAALTRAALRWSDGDVEPDLSVPGRDDLDWSKREVRHGWTAHPGRVIHNYGRGVALHTGIEATWTTMTIHGSGHPDERPTHSGSQQGIEQHSTPLRALKALRRAVEQRAAEQLRAIDLLIAEELEP